MKELEKEMQERARVYAAFYSEDNLVEAFEAGWMQCFERLKGEKFNEHEQSPTPEGEKEKE